jgi:magnesium chelatase subunit I
MGAENVGRELIRQAVGDTFGVYLGSVDLRPVVSYFESGGSLKLRDDAGADDLLAELRKVPGLLEHVPNLGISSSDPSPLLAAAGEFILEGLYAQKKIGRSEDRGYVAPERPDADVDLERLERLRRMKKQVN